MRLASILGTAACAMLAAASSACAPTVEPGPRDGGSFDAGRDAGRCGNVLAACCAAATCRAGARCSEDTCCVYPGGLGCGTSEQCCAGFECRGGRCCADSTRACRRSHDCCDGLVCVDGACEPGTPVCGHADEPCCDDDVCASGFVCAGARCVACGGAREVCCKPPDQCDPGLVCESGSCTLPVTCGHEREVCCRAGECTDGLACESGMCERRVTAACDVPECSTCTVTDGCGWCSTTSSCVPGTADGPTTGACVSWVWLQPRCSGGPPPTCDGASCASCTGTSSCGWCESTSACAAGTSVGPSTTSCAAWRWLGSECTAPATCAAASCDGCTVLPGCGWCQSTGSCMAGSASGPTSGACADFRYYVSQCSVSTACAAATCGACTLMSSCGWCDTTGTCVTGSSTGPTSGACATWRWLSTECSGAT